MANEEFKVGDVVMLNSGGPHMTIIKVEDRGAWLMWVDHQQSAALPAKDRIGNLPGVIPFDALTRAPKPHGK